MAIKLTRKNNKLISILWVVFYMAIVALLVVTTCMMHNKFYYAFYYVDGTSMYPTLNGNENANKSKDFGIIDTHERIFTELKRFDIVITYYPGDYDSEGNLKENTSSKIKRIIAFPGETIRTFTITDSFGNKTGGFSIFTEGFTPSGSLQYQANYYYIDEVAYPLTDLPFTPNHPGNIKPYFHNNTKVSETTEDEYFVIGDNWGASKDSTSVGAITRKMMTGVLIAIEGTCDIDEYGNAFNFRYKWPVFFKK